MANVSSSNGLEKRPKLRFPGFDEPWEHKELLHYLVENTDRNKQLKFGKENVLSVSGEYGIVNQIAFQGRSFAGESVADYAILENRQIQFQYYEYTQQKERVLKHNGYFYKLDPYALEWKNDYYYLIGYSHKHHGMAHFRVDRLAGIEILESTYVPQPDFDVADYTNKMIDMFAAGHTVLVELLCENRFMKTIVDDYGEAVPTHPYDSEHFVAQIEVNPSGTFYGWVFKFMGGVKITAPQKCVEEMARIARTFL